MAAVSVISMIISRLTDIPLVDFIVRLWSDFFADNHAGGHVYYTEGPAAPWNICGLAFSSLLIILCIAILVLFLAGKLQRMRITTRFLKRSFVIAWLLAFVVYDVGMYTGQCVSLLTNAPMSILHAFETFLLSSDVSTIHDSFHSSWIFMCAFSLSHALSAFVSMVFIVKVFGFNLIQKLRLYRESISKMMKRETYVFWGVSDVTYDMVETINRHYEGDKNAYRIIIVKTLDNDDNSSATKIGINKIFELLSLNDAELQKLQSLGCFITTAPLGDMRSLSEYSSNDVNEVRAIIRRELHLKSLAKLLTPEKTSDAIHFLFLSDDENQNLHDVSVLLKDSTLNSFRGLGSESDDETFVGTAVRKVVFYCHARHNGVHRVIEDLHYSKNIEVRVIDSSHINVELLKSNDDVLPVNFVEVEADATVSSAFNAMVIGFSEVGQDATRFLYEFGAFVKTGGDNDHAVRSEFHLDVIDRNMKDKAGLFMANAPAIKPSVAFIPELKNPEALIELHNDDCLSAEFRMKIEEKIKTLNYVVIATEDDELNMSMGVRIFGAATRYRDNLDRLCILVRIHNDDDRHFSNIADYYNKLWASQDETDVCGANPNKRFKESDECKLPLYIFGQDNKVYTYCNIIDNSIIQKAVEYKERYAASTDDNYKKPSKQEAKKWYKDIDDLLQVNSEYHPSYARLMKLRRTQRQDIANSQHERTKQLLRDKAVARINLNDYQWSSLQRSEKRTEYKDVSGGKPKPVDVRIVRLLTVLAQTEHLRWNASHEILGYVYKNAKNEIRLYHNCLTEWAKLDEEKRSYDHNVVDLSLGIRISKPDKA